jgi:hypothetical protein
VCKCEREKEREREREREVGLAGTARERGTEIKGIEEQ